MRYFRLIRLWLASLGLVILVSCNAQPNSATSGTTTSGTTGSQAPAAMEHSGMSHGKKININNAILSELDKLEGMLGVPALSNKIQASRPYGKAEELVTKNVISQAQYDQVKDLVTVEEVVLT